MLKRGFISCVLLLLLSQWATAQITDFSWTPTDPVMGDWVTYTAGPNADPVKYKPKTYKWEYKYISGACNGTWVVDGRNLPGVGFPEARPGTWTMRLTVTYYDVPGTGNPPTSPMPLPPNVKEKNVTIAPADGIFIEEGLNTPRKNGYDTILKFKIMAGNKPCGPHLRMNTGYGVWAQEKIYNKWLRPPLQGAADDQDWTPNPPSDTGKFHIEPNWPKNWSEVWDTKENYIHPLIWDNWPNAEYARTTQDIRLYWFDPCGDPQQIIILQGFTLYRIKDGENYYLSTLPP